MKTAVTEAKREKMMEAIARELEKMDYNKLTLVLTFGVGLNK